MKRLSGGSDSSEADKSSLDEHNDHFMNKFNDLNNILSRFGESIFADNTLDMNGDSEFKSELDNDDEITRFKEGLKNLDISDEKLKMNDLRERLQSNLDLDDNSPNPSYYESLDNPWEKVPSNNGIPQTILNAPVTDDYKLSLYDTNLRNNDVIAFDRQPNGLMTSLREEEETHCEDFRTLRAVLQGKSMLVRTSRGQPEVVGVVVGDAGEARMLTRTLSRLTTIVDADEEDEVRVTTL